MKSKRVDPVPVPSSTTQGLNEAFMDLDRRSRVLADEHQRATKRWSRTYFVVGLPAAALAAIAGVTALASTTGRIPAGIIALCSAALGAAAAFLDSETRRKAHEQLAAAWRALANDVEMNIRVDLPEDDWRTRRARSVLEDHQSRERKLLQGRVPDPTAEAERQAEIAELKGRLLADVARATAKPIAGTETM